jgi:hypothetical protein
MVALRLSTQKIATSYMNGMKAMGSVTGFQVRSLANY